MFLVFMKPHISKIFLAPAKKLSPKHSAERKRSKPPSKQISPNRVNASNEQSSQSEHQHVDPVPPIKVAENVIEKLPTKHISKKSSNNSSVGKIKNISEIQV